ncbi:MAG: nucleoside triphosphate pyrophosphohydrolase family protein [Ktedonobacterales bacterium]
MDLDSYRRDVLRTAPPDLTLRDRLLLGALGLAGESGEVADALKKMLFHSHPLDEAALRDELGDVMWYVMFLCDTLGLSLEDVMDANVEKRRKRYPEGFSAERSINRDQ